MSGANSELVRRLEEVWPKLTPKRQRLLSIAATLISEGQEKLAVELVESELGCKIEGPRAEEARRGGGAA